jgi:hypothetical protein
MLTDSLQEDGISTIENKNIKPINIFSLGIYME